MNMYLNYDNDNPINVLPQNEIEVTAQPDLFFNSVIPTFPSEFQQQTANKLWNRVFCAVRGNFITIEYTLNAAQMAGVEQEQDIQIDAQVLWRREAGRMSF